KDLSRTSVHLEALVSKCRKGGAEVIAISPTGDTGPCDVSIRIRPGTDRFLAAALIRLLMKRKGIPEAIAERASNLEAFREIIQSRSVEEFLALCHVSESDLEKLYAAYSGAGPVATVMGWGLQRHRFGAENVRFINGLAFLSGNIGRSGGGSYFNVGSLRNFNLGWAALRENERQRTLLLPAIGREIIEASDPPIRMIWANGCNVINQAPDSMTTAWAFERVGFKVVVDGFMTDTAERADLVLPCALMPERETIVGSFLHNFVGYAGKAIDPPGEARDDYSILADLARRLGIELPKREEILASSLRSDYLDVSLEDLKQRGFAEAKRSCVAFAGMCFNHPDGRYRFPEAIHEEPAPPEGYPLRFLTLIRKDAIHSQILPEDQMEIPTVCISPENPVLAKIRPEAAVFVASPLGRLRVRVETDPSLQPEVLVYRRGDWMKCFGGANQLIEPLLTDAGEGAAFYSQYVRLEQD
ncbi:MAG: molybdopterin-dependent oxidoreductase, partial [Acidobacteriota bacterium]